MAEGLGASWKFEIRSPEPKHSIVDFVLARMDCREARGKRCRGHAVSSSEPGNKTRRGDVETPVFEIRDGGLAFHLVFHRPDEAEIQAVGTVLSKAANLQRLRVVNAPWSRDIQENEGPEGKGRSYLSVSCVFPLPPDLYRGLRELEVYRKGALAQPGLPYPEEFEGYRGLLVDGPWPSSVATFGYSMMDEEEYYFTQADYGRSRPPVTPRPVPHEVFTLEVQQLARRALPTEGDPRPLFPSVPDAYFAAVDSAHQELLKQYTERSLRGFGGWDDEDQKDEARDGVDDDDACRTGE